MSLYQESMASGLTALASSYTGASAESDAVYNEQYKREGARRAAAGRLDAAQSRIAVTQGNLMLSNLEIQIKQADAEAMTKVSAAVAGVEGSSIEQALQQAGTNAAFAKARVKQQIDQGIELELGKVNSSALDMLGVQDVTTTSAAERLMTTLSTTSKEEVGQVIDYFDYSKET